MTKKKRYISNTTSPMDTKFDLKAIKLKVVIIVLLKAVKAIKYVRNGSFNEIPPKIGG